MRVGLIITVAATLLTSTAFGQYAAPPTEDRPAPSSPSAGQTPSTQQVPPIGSSPSGPAVRAPEGNVPSAPVAGANSFTEAEVKARIESQGFANVTELTKSDDGIWLGMAQREGRTFQVALDYQGNVFFRPAS